MNGLDDYKVKATFIPRTDPKSVQLRFNLQLFYKGKFVLEFNYGMGVGLVKQHSKYKGYVKRKADEWALETGKVAIVGHADTVYSGKEIRPEIESVLHCLVMDSTALGMIFQDWANNYGYNEDSISAFETYKLCLKQSTELLKGIGTAELNRLRELFQDF